MRQSIRSILSVLLAVPLVLGLLTGCVPAEETQAPFVIGYMGGLSGRSSGLGLAGRDGAQLAVEQVNAAGGVAGRQVALEVADDAAGGQAARDAVSTLADAGAAVIVGPLTSASASEAIPVANERQVPLLSPTVSSTDFSGADDYFLRTCADNRQYAIALSDRVAAEYDRPMRVSAVYDAGNASYTRSLFEHFREAVEARDGMSAEPLSFVSGENPDYASLAASATVSDPDAVFVAANAIDSAMLSQHLRNRGYKGRILLAHWAATDDLISNGGDGVEKVLFMDNLDRASGDPKYLAMKKAFIERFGYEPNFAAIHSYDAANMAISALGADSKTPPKEALLSSESWDGIQGAIALDENGDTDRPFYPMTVMDGKFAPSPAP